MTEELVSFDVTVLARSKGFDIVCKDYLNNKSMIVKDLYYFNRPTCSLLKKWLRDKHDIHIIMSPNYESQVPSYSFIISSKPFNGGSSISFDAIRGTYEDVLDCALEEALKLLPTVYFKDKEYLGEE